MNDNVKLLNSIYQNAQMGIGTLERMIGLTKDSKFKAFLTSQLKGYLSLAADAEKLLHQAGVKAEGLTPFEKMRTHLMFSAEVFRDKSPSHLAEMLLLGSNMGIIGALKNIRKYENTAEKDLCGLMRKTLVFEECSAEKLKHFI